MKPVADKIDIDVLVSRPMSLKIVEKERPIERQTVFLEVLQRERKAVIDADKRAWSCGEHRNQPLTNASASPVLAWAGRRLNLLRDRETVGFVNAQCLETRPGRLCARVVDANVSFEQRTHLNALRECQALFSYSTLAAVETIGDIAQVRSRRTHASRFPQLLGPTGSNEGLPACYIRYRHIMKLSFISPVSS